MVFAMLPAWRQFQRTPFRAAGLSLALVLASVQFLFPLQPVDAGDVFYYVDREGTMHFTDAPTDSRFRKLRGPVSAARSATLPEPNPDLNATIARHSSQHRLDPALIRAVIKAESDFDPTAVSRAGAMGLMQLMPHTARRLDVRDPYNPEENVRGGAQYLRYLLDRFHGNVPLALAAYNAGATKVERYRNLPPIDETRRYVSKVLRFYHAFLASESDALLRSAGTVRSSANHATLVFAALPVR